MTVEIDGREVQIVSDFRACLRTIMAFEDPELTETEKLSIMLANLGLDSELDHSKAIEAGMRFLNGGESHTNDDEQPMRLYAFGQDGNLIFAAFRQTHGIDLDAASIHWWKFLALFMDLGADTAFCNLIGMRKRIKTGTASKEEMKEYRQNRELYDLPEADTMSMEDKVKRDRFMQLAGLK